MGSAARASSVFSSKGGISSAKRIFSDTGTLTLYTRFPSMAEATRPPDRAGLVLSGWPSIWAARLIRSVWDRGLPIKRLAPRMPATIQAELLPRPRAMGMLFSWMIFSPGSFLPQIS